MSDETRMRSNRAFVVMSLQQAANELKEHGQSVDDVLADVAKAKKRVIEAQGLSNNKPLGKRALPAPIRRELAAVIKRIEEAERRIRAVPVTARERAEVRK